MKKQDNKKNYILEKQEFQGNKSKDYKRILKPLAQGLYLNF
jgi:hypothetical protein